MNRTIAISAIAAVASSTPVHGQDVDELQKVFGGGYAVAREGVWAFSQSIVFRLNEGVWSRHQLLSPQGGFVQGFGSAVGLSGNVVVVGAPFDDHSGLDDAGSAYVFQRDPDTNQWVEVQKLTASDAEDEDVFGWSVAIEGDLIAIGAPNHGNDGTLWQAWTGFGAAYVFEKVGEQWQQKGIVGILGGAEPGDRFGYSVAVTNGHAIAGAPWDDIDFGGDTVIDAGSAWTVRKFAQQWLTGERIIGTSPDDEDLFGVPVVARPDRLGIGAVSDDHGALNKGAVYLLRPEGTSWVHDAALRGTSSGLFFGRSVALGDGVIAVAARPYDEDIEEVLDERIHIYRLDNGLWLQTDVVRPIDAPDLPEGYPQNFGVACALDGETLVVGAPDDDELGTNAGAAYVFDLSGQSGTRAILTDVTVAFGTPISVELNHLETSEDARAIVRSHFGFTALEANVADLRIGATNHVEDPAMLDLLIEARMNQAGGTMKVRLRNWNTNSFNLLRQYSIGGAETVEMVPDALAASYIRAMDDRIEVSLRSSAVVTFSALGFQEQTDFVNLLVHD